MPELVGLEREAAELIVASLGLELSSVSSEFNNEVSEGLVISQSPAPGTSLTSGASVQLAISNGPLVLPQADIETNLFRGIEPLTVNFVDSSLAGSGEIESWSWDFGDPASGEANNSSEQNAIHIYEIPGSYTATLEISTEHGADSASLDITVTSVPLVSVPAGSFNMGDPLNEGQDDELPVHSVTLSAYEIGVYEITNQEYADMLNWANLQGYLSTVREDFVGGYGYELIDLDDDTCLIEFVNGRFVPEKRDGYSMAEHPVLEVVWVGGAAFCNWLSEIQGLQPCYDTTTWACDFNASGYHLPTEAQWERAAAWDGTRYYRYPLTSDELDESIANYSNANPLELTMFPRTTPVGFYPNSLSPVGCYDMCGGAWEWCNDSYDPEYYGVSPEIDPPGPAISNEKVRRGGGWAYIAESCRSSNRTSSPINTSHDATGFRVARQALQK